MGSFHDEGVAESDGARERVDGENRVRGGQRNVFVAPFFSMRVYFDKRNVPDVFSEARTLGSGNVRSCGVTDLFMVPAPVDLLTFFAAVPHCVACRAPTGTKLIAVLVTTPVFHCHCVTETSFQCNVKKLQAKSK